MNINQPYRSVSGFTLIELVVVIAILAILAATAIPKFIDLRSQAVVAAAQGVAGAISSGTSVNFAARAVGSTLTGSATVVSTCAQSIRTLQGAVTPTGASFPAGPTSVAPGLTTACVFNYTSGSITTAATAVVIGSS